MNAEIESYLISERGFAKDENIFTKINKVVTGETIINGQVQQQIQDIKLQIEYSGDGWVGKSETNNTPLEGYTLSVNGFKLTDIWVRDLNDFKDWIGKL